MNGIGLKGLRSVLEEHQKWKPRTTRLEAERILWKSKLVQSQLTQIEELCRSFDVICLYNTKAHPWLAMIEKFWRMVKNALENLFTFSNLELGYQKIVEQMMSGDFESRRKCDKWFKLALKSAEYYARGGSEVLREGELRHLDLSQMPAPAARYRFVNIEDLRAHAHNVNWILLRSKQFEAGEVYW